MKTIKLLIPIVVSLFALNFSNAQSPEQMIKDWERARDYTKEYLDAMPDDGYSFKPTTEIRSFAEEMLHLAEVNFGIASIMSSIKSPFERGMVEKLADKSKASVTKVLMDSYNFVINDLKSMKPEQLSSQVKVFKYEMTTATAFNKMFEHQTHMRGQTTVYLHLKGIKVPQEKLF